MAFREYESLEMPCVADGEPEPTYVFNSLHEQLSGSLSYGPPSPVPYLSEVTVKKVLYSVPGSDVMEPRRPSILTLICLGYCPPHSCGWPCHCKIILDKIRQ